MGDPGLVTLHGLGGAIAVVAPALGGWLLRYARPIPPHGLVDALYFSQPMVDTWPAHVHCGIPILFPMASKSLVDGVEGRWAWNGQVRELPQHGFARRRPWTVVMRSAAALTMELADDDETRALYPFAFRHRVTYRVEAERLVWEQEIENRSAEPMPFSTGFHPYLPVPITPSGRREDCVVELPAAVRRTTDARWETYGSMPQTAARLAVAVDVRDTLLLTQLAEPRLALVDPASNLEIVLDTAGAPQFGVVAIWSESPASPSYCIEPWTALPNVFTRDEDDLIRLAPGATFRATMSLAIRPAAQPA